MLWRRFGPYPPASTGTPRLHPHLPLLPQSLLWRSSRLTGDQSVVVPPLFKDRFRLVFIPNPVTCGRETGNGNLSPAGILYKNSVRTHQTISVSRSFKNNVKTSADTVRSGSGCGPQTLRFLISRPTARVCQEQNGRNNSNIRTVLMGRLQVLLRVDLE